MNEAIEKLAEGARRVLQAEAIILTLGNKGAFQDRIVAFASGPRRIRPTYDRLEQLERDLGCGRLRQRRVTHLCTSTGKWSACSLYAGTAPVPGGVFVLRSKETSPHPALDATMSVLAGRFGSVIAASTQSRGETDVVSVARSMAELGLTADSYEELTYGITAAIAPMLDASKGGVGLWHRDSHYLQLLPGSFGSDATMAASSQIRGSDPRSGAARVRLTGKPYFTNNLERDMPRYAKWLRLMGVERLMTLPLPVEGRVAGVLHVANKRADFVNDDIQLAMEIVPFVAGAVEHVRDRLETRRREALADEVNEAATQVAQGESLQGLHPVLEDFGETLGACALGISFSDETPAVVVHNRETEVVTMEAFLAASATAGSALRTATRRPRAARDKGWTAIHAPVVVGGRLEATFSLLRVPCEPFSKDELAAIRRMASVAALAWATERVQREREQTARMRERQRIADDLHDHVAQILFSGQLTVQSILEQLNDAEIVPALARARDVLVRSQTSIREVIHHLASPTPDGLLAGLASIAAAVDQEFGIRVDLSAAPAAARAATSLAEDTTEVALRTAREAVTNAAKHARGTRIRVDLRTRANRLIVVVDDDGPGMPPDRRWEGYGLRAMRRNLQASGGLLRISRNRLGGTRSLISLPIGA